MELAFGVAAYSAGGPQPSNEPDVCWQAPSDAGGTALARPAVPVLLRRRVSPIGQAALRVAWALPQVEQARFVFASRHGEFDRALSMLQEVADEDGPSPADFSLGVHNALAGLLSICTRNRGGHIALAAGVDSFGFGLLEAAACLQERPEEPVMLVYYDAALPAGYPDATPACADVTLALALVLVPPPRASRRVVMAARPIADTPPGEAAAAVFLRFLRTTAPEASATGERMVWHWRHA
ncbi:MAG: beta-ketoacyl synthase chain length factor [Acetobacteraceae bacterium]